VGLKFKYQFDDIIAAGNLKKHKNSEVDEPVSKKMKLNDNKITTILEYSSVQRTINEILPLSQVVYVIGKTFPKTQLS